MKPSFKLFPLNLTARAADVVRGNPVTTRPDSGVENCFPGLEFDQRNLDKVFFPGVVFEFHHDFGVIVRDFTTNSDLATMIGAADIQAGVFLMFVRGVFAARARGVAPSARVVRFAQPAGLESWRVVRDLEPGPVAVVLGDMAAMRSMQAGVVDSRTVIGWLQDPTAREMRVDGVGRFFLLFGARARYLTDEGVIEPATMAAGDLTRSLCAPWQYDFADCGCFYWASNKPDVVSSPSQPEQVLNFQRRDRSAEADAAATAETWVLGLQNGWDSARHILRHREMIERWAELPFVHAGRETDRVALVAAPPAGPLLSRAEITQRLRQLAPVEHALAVEYLYAYYSLALPATRPTSSAGIAARIWTAGEEVLQVAIDEMRHLRAVNEILISLGEAPELTRATIVGEDFDGNGHALQQPFALLPLTGAQLDFFIEVERASQNHAGDHDSIDGMYTLLLRSIVASSEFSEDEKQRLAAFIKVIIDEGMEHFRRFERVKTALAGISEDDYLKVKAAPQRLPDDSDDRILQDTVDAAYHVVLRSLDYVFRLGDLQRGAMVEAARRAMYNMDDATRSLSTRGVGALFELAPPYVAGPPTAGAAGLAVASAGPRSPEEVGAPLRALFARLEGSGHGDLAQRLRGRLDGMIRAFQAAREGATR